MQHTLLHLGLLLCSILGIIILCLLLLAGLTIGLFMWSVGRMHSRHGTDWDER
jgi:hypothetical protein